ncbi:unnamed protein product [Heligmosomoides polygyrus]|uniref:Reverse transcriptase domain-containing protein n=1 Tax=Heligmosomoides polygyrus TaxID=6339 RepID=A0A3P8A2A1_HELPZ|nr:unnamed protein product [Heligmosomoides polygyrus]
MVVRGSVQSSFNFNQIKTKTVENLIFQLINDVTNITETFPLQPGQSAESLVVAVERSVQQFLEHGDAAIRSCPLAQGSALETLTDALVDVRDTGPDDLAADVWKLKLWYPAEWLTEFFNQVVKEKKVPECWHNSTTIPIWKKKGSPADCPNYRPIRFLSHSMKIFERILDRRIREIVKLSNNQCGFVSGCGTIDAIHAARLLVEKHREKQKSVHIAFLDLEKALDRAESWPATKEVETRLSVMGTKMLRWTAGVTRMDRIRNYAIWQKFEVGPIADRMREARLRWDGHDLRGKKTASAR